MKIQDKDFYYGVALTQIAECPTFTSINKLGDKDGLFRITDQRAILIKYSKADKGEWRFTFQKDDFEESYNYYYFFVVLVCADDTICLLTSTDLNEILDTEADAVQWVSVSSSDEEQLRVKGSLGDLSHTVAHNAFPRYLFDSEVDRITEFSEWPPFSRFNFYRRPPTLYFSSVDRWIDFTDNLTNIAGFEEGKPIYFGLTTTSHLWKTWTEENLQEIEELIKNDLGFDGFDVEVERISRKLNKSCEKEFLWKLKITDDDYEEDDDDYSDDDKDNDELNVEQPVSDGDSGDEEDVASNFQKTYYLFDIIIRLTIEVEYVFSKDEIETAGSFTDALEVFIEDIKTECSDYYSDRTNCYPDSIRLIEQPNTRMSDNKYLFTFQIDLGTTNFSEDELDEDWALLEDDWILSEETLDRVLDEWKSQFKKCYPVKKIKLHKVSFMGNDSF